MNNLSDHQITWLIQTVWTGLQQINPALDLYQFQKDTDHIRIKDDNHPEYTQIGRLYPRRLKEVLTFNYQGFKDRPQEEQDALLAFSQKIDQLVIQLVQKN